MRSLKRGPESPRENHLLAALTAEEYERLAPELRPVDLRLGKVLFEAGTVPDCIYFPSSGLVSLLNHMSNGATGEVAVIGSEGCVGVAALLGGGRMLTRAVVQIAGRAWQINSHVVLEEFGRGGMLQRALLRFIQALLTQISQTAACNRHHTVEQQLCRWLLLSLDRIDSTEIRMTQELIANMLGARRTGITEAARKLRDAELIDYRRGRIVVPDRALLEARVCECYEVVKKETGRLLGPALTRSGAEAWRTPRAT